MSELGRALLDQLDDRDLDLLAGRLADRLSARGGGWLDTKAAAAYAGCSVPALRYAMSKGEVEFEQSCAGGKVYFRPAALDQWRQQ
jgi:hypothetical protein